MLINVSYLSNSLIRPFSIRFSFHIRELPNRDVSPNFPPNQKRPFRGFSISRNLFNKTLKHPFERGQYKSSVQSQHNDMASIFRRSLATAAATVKPPVQLFGLDGTYASALYTAAAKASSVDGAAKSLESLKSVIAKDSKVSGYLANPALSAGDRSIVATTLAKQVPSLDKSVSNLLTVLGENNRLDLLESIFSQFKVLTDAHNGVVEAIVTSASQLDSKLLKKIESSITKSEFVGEGKTLRLTNKVNADIQGGLIVEVGDRTVDLSIASKIAKLNQVLKEAI